MSTGKSNKKYWSKEQIRAARRVDLVPLLQHQHVELRDKPANNYEVLEHRGLIVKNNYWWWPDEDLQGNTIDYFMCVVGLSFAESMSEINALYRL